ncbi:uncharacterized protein LOC118514605 [Anopheles stephensi]|uniref:uncharacterized protein LOC118514605 n=1 Tax=Anopheles stephensi TaxID=30069 RepID=UPI001658875E|nr:uncharacterized protein LOC118514605 [Anopheles stephensi]
MPRSPRKKQKTAHYQRSSRNRVAAEQAQLEQTDQEGNRLTLFGKTIAIDEQDRDASYYAKLRFWFRHAIPQQSEDSPMPRMRNASTPACASPNARQSHQEFDVPPRGDTGIFQQIPPPLPTNLPPYPTVRPFQRNALLNLNKINDPKILLEQHIAHWKKVRKNWILYRQMYLQRYKPCFDFIFSKYVHPMP